MTKAKKKALKAAPQPAAAPSEKRKRGAKSGFNALIQSRIASLAHEGKTVEQIADIIGVSKRTIYNWMGAHQDLLHAMRAGRQTADELVEASLFSRAVGYSHPETKLFQCDGSILSEKVERHYPPDTTAAMFWLRNRQPARWREKTEGDVIVNPAERLTDEQLDARIQAMLAKQKGKKP